MKKVLFIVCTLFFFVGCSSTVTTPAIEGTVIDKVTKQPVENAWIMATAEIVTYNPEGEVGTYYLLNKPHTRTDKEGKFSIPSISTGGLGAKLTWLRIDIYTPEGKRGAIDIDTAKGRIPYPIVQDGEAVIQPSASLKEKNLTVAIPVKHVEMTVEQAREELGELAGYCGDGRYHFSHPIIENACDNMERDYLIEECEKLLKKMENLEMVKDKAAYSNHMLLLAALHDQRGNYLKAIDYYQKL